jgi:toxin ParE1/3/4
LRALLELNVLERAQGDIYSIIEYGVQAHGEESARAYLSRISHRINWLCANPKLGPIHPQLDSQIRSFAEGRHRIYYRADTAQLTVIRILHQSMDARQQFN